MPVESETVDELVAITSLPAAEARTLLGVAGGDLATAVQLHFDEQDGAARAGASAQDAEAAAALAAEEYGDDEEVEGEEYFPEEEDLPPDYVPPPRAARSPQPAGDGGAVAPMQYPRLGMLYGWMARNVPFFGAAERLARLVVSTGIVSFIGTLLWAPLALVGLVGPTGRRGGPAGPVRPFVEWFEEHHGPTHPRFFRGSCQSALSRSRADARFMLAYLHEHGAPECEEFCSKVLASALFTAFADENFVVWVGEQHTPEGRAVRRALRISQQPAVVMLAHGDMAAAAGMGPGRRGGDDAPVQALGSVQGPRALNEEGLIASLAASRRATRLDKAGSLPPEPPPGAEATRLVIRLPDGRRLDRRFDKSAPLQAAIDLVESADPDGDDVDLVSNFPRKMRGETLDALGLHPAATLFTQEIDDDE